MKLLAGKTLFITGASRGIGLAIALKAARDGANIAIAAKSSSKVIAWNGSELPGTIYTAAEEITAAGGSALPLVCDIRFDDQVQAAIDATVEKFGGIDIVVNNASAIDLRGIDKLDMKRYDLMQQINARGSYLCANLALPHLKKSSNAHILTLSPPLDLNPKWFSPNLAYTMAKFGMSMVTLGLSESLKPLGIAANSLWPETTIATAAVTMLGGEALTEASRTPEIVANAAYIILTSDARTCTGNFFLDVDVLRETGVENFDRYAVKPGHPLRRDLFLSGSEFLAN